MLSVDPYQNQKKKTSGRERSLPEKPARMASVSFRSTAFTKAHSDAHRESCLWQRSHFHTKAWVPVRRTPFLKLAAVGYAWDHGESNARRVGKASRAMEGERLERECVRGARGSERRDAELVVLAAAS